MSERPPASWSDQEASVEIGSQFTRPVPSARLKATAPSAPEDRFTPTLREAFEAIPTPATRARATLLADNLEAWNARWKLLESARDRVTAQYYTWDHDIFGKAQLGHVFLKARQGADVTVMVDAVGDTFGQRGFKSHRGGKDYLQELVRLPNARAKVYHPHYKKLPNALLHPCGMQGIAANHDKILEVDGRAASVGGRNTGYQYFTHPLDDPAAWRDCDVLLEGAEAAQELREAVDEEFDRRWINHPVRPDLLGNWRKRDLELLGAYALMDHWLKAPELSEAEKEAVRNSPERQAELAGQLVEEVLESLPALGMERAPSKRERKALQAMAEELVSYPELRGTYHADRGPAVEAEVKIIDKTSAVGTGLDEMNPALLSLIEGARETILLQTPYYVLTDPVIDALRDASERGVDIQVATNSPSNTDSYFTQVFFLNDWKKSMATIPSLELHAATGERKHHAKLAVVDEQVSFVGTYNLDLVSAAVNGEVGAVVWSPEFARQVSESMADDLADPTVAYREYQIARNEQGQPLDAQGQPAIDEQGRLVAMPATVYGPEDHVDPEVLAKYDRRIGRWNWSREHLPQFRSVRRFAGKGVE